MARHATLRQSGRRGFLVAPASDVPESWGDRLDRWIERLYAAADRFGVRRGWLPPPPEPPPEPSQGPLGDPADLPVELLLDLESLLAGYAPPPALRPTARQRGTKVHAEIIFGSVSSLGMLLTVLTVQSELTDRESLSRRLTQGPSERSWAYGIEAGRYLTPDRGICLKVTILMPAEDVPEVVARLTADRAG
jgi:hypothetical protein